MFNYLNSSGIDKFTFYRMPKMLFTDDFQSLSCEAKILYGLLLDRSTLSKQNHWIDENDRVYVYFKQDEAMDMLNIKKNKVISIFKELDDIGLIRRKKLGQGNPTRIYVMNFSEQSQENATEGSEDLLDDILADKSQTSSENTKREVKKFEKPTSEFQTSPKSTKKEVKRFEKPTSKGLKNKLGSSYYINKTERNNINQSINEGIVTKPTSALSAAPDKKMDEIYYLSTVEKVKSQISYDELIAEGKGKSTLDLIVSLIVDVYLRNCESIYANGMLMPVERVVREFEKVEYEHILYVFECVENASAKHEIINIRNYLQTCIFNAPHTMDIFYDAQVNYDMHNKFHKQE